MADDSKVCELCEKNPQRVRVWGGRKIRCYKCNALMTEVAKIDMRICSLKCKSYWTFTKINKDCVEVFCEDTECTACGTRNDPTVKCNVTAM